MPSYIDLLRNIYKLLGALRNYSKACSNYPKITNDMAKRVDSVVSEVSKLLVRVSDIDITQSFIYLRKSNASLQNSGTVREGKNNVSAVYLRVCDLMTLIEKHAKSLDIKKVNS